MKAKAVAMSSIYMDKGEGKTYVVEQIHRMAKLNPEYYFFDVICRPDQLMQAGKMLNYFYWEIGELIPELAKNRIFTGITCDEMIRPAAMALIVMNKGADVDVLNVNPERRR